MRLIKKIISSVCVLSMVSALVAMPMIAHAEDKTGFSLSISKDADFATSGTGVATISLTNAATLCPTDNQTIVGAQFDLVFDDNFDLSYYSTEKVNRKEKYKINETKVGTWEGDFTQAPYAEEVKGTRLQVSNAALYEDVDLIEVKFKVVDLTKAATLKLDLAKVNVRDDALSKTLDYTSANGDLTVNSVIVNEGAAVDPNAAEKIGNFADGENDNAVAFKKVFDAETLKDKTTMTLKAKIDGKEYPYKKGAAIALPNLSGEDSSLSIGVVIQYKDATVNVESLAIELQ